MTKRRTNQDSGEQRHPFGGHDDLLERFSIHLQGRGHRGCTQQAYMTVAKHFLQWLTTGQAEDRTKVTRETVQFFLQKHLPVCCCPQAGHRNLKMVRAALNQLLLIEGYERIRAVSNPSASPYVEASVQKFDHYLHAVCGLAEATRWYQRRHARAFLNWLFKDRPLVFAEIRPNVLVRFVTEHAKHYRPGSIGVLVYSLRSYLRFLVFNGKVSTSMATAIPRPRIWSLASLPSSLKSTELERFWATFDRTKAIGRRDYAISRYLADLGLHCCEVAIMTLDAIDWHAGVLRLPETKVRREDMLPIPKSMGQALVDYLCRGRPTTDTRAVFVHHRAPKGHAVQSSTVRGAVRRAFARADLPWTGTHVLRHTMATRLFQGGASLKEIADVLRHRSLDTTQIYTKVNLGQAALPGGHAVAGDAIMSCWSSMHERVEAYLSARRSLGYALYVEGEELERFADFAEAQWHRAPLTEELALAWANASKRGSALYRARRLEIVRGLAKYCSLFEPETEIPAQGLLGPAHRRVTPHIYSEQEIEDLLDATTDLVPRKGLRPVTMRVLLGLLAATGLRVSEALHLTRTDVDLIQGVLTVRETKFRKSRYVPLHPTTVEALIRDYAHMRDRQVPLTQEAAFFLADDGRRFRYRQALYAFQRLRRQLGWQNRDGRRPRLYDLRHTFACRRLLAWYREGVDVGWALPLLATYLGHGKVTDTYWYLTGIPALMAISSERFERLVCMDREVHHG